MLMTWKKGKRSKYNTSSHFQRSGLLKTTKTVMELENAVMLNCWCELATDYFGTRCRVRGSTSNFWPRMAPIKKGFKSTREHVWAPDSHLNDRNGFILRLIEHLLVMLD